MRISDWSSDVCSSDLVDGVISAIPVVEGQVMVTAHNTAVGGLVRGLRGEDLKRRPILANNIVAGSIENFDEEGGLLIGRRMAQRMGLLPGDRLTLISPQGNATAFGTIPRMKAYRIVAIFEVGMSEYDSSLIRSEEHTSDLQSLMRHS